MRGLFVGRFQPFHNGHLKAIEWVLRECSDLIVLVGSSQACYEVENPFTVGERIEMVHDTLKASKLLEKCIILSIPDVNNNALWIAHVNSLVPKYDVVYTNNSLTRKLFQDAGRQVKDIPFFDRLDFDGTKIRKAMLKGTGWQKFVPKEVEKFIEKKKIIQRVQTVATGDKMC
ncbi:nicotinamide-nucleotide adenylyltransferase [Candidatus Micrarchaeota archaeon]|nr:nicotinamide-nucleotide adenylyltransferase [Candidatus Micrarchaeota archaeon]